MSAQGFLDRLGLRLRAVREERSLSLAELARRAGVSRRYLTDAEAGRANLSVAVLVALGEALGMTPSALLDVDRAARRERIALLGLRGAGKSTIGARLARALEVPFVELDRRIEEHAGLSLSELFDLHGPDAFRRYEAETLERVLAEGERCVLATGGSLVTSAATFARLRATCFTVWLRAPPEEHFRRVMAQGDRRPFQVQGQVQGPSPGETRPRAMQELRAILSSREPLYAQCALTLDTGGRTPEEVVEQLLAELGDARAERESARATARRGARGA